MDPQTYAQIAQEHGVAAAVLVFLLGCLVVVGVWMSRQFEWFKKEVAQPTVSRHLSMMDQVSTSVEALKVGQQQHTEILQVHGEALNEIKEAITTGRKS
jgi:hypothetical protein